MELLRRIENRSAPVAVLGLGYVGLPLAMRAASARFRVVGLDPDRDRIAALTAGRSYLLDVDSAEVAGALASGRLSPTTDPEALRSAEVIVICVPTPLKDGLPDMSYIEAAGKEVARALGEGRLVILESTSYPGTTEDFLKGILESSGLHAGTGFYLGFSPERVDPGNPRHSLEKIPKIVGGIDETATRLMTAFYSAFVEQVVPVSSPRVAEMAKLLENTYRHVNIALANEMAMLCHDLGMDVWEVIEAAATKPFGFQPFYPGPGWGGSCIPVDPAYLSWRVRQMGETARFVELGREINARMPGYVVSRISECLNDRGRALKDARILILGVTYKKDVADLRESPAPEIVSRLMRGGADVSFHDPFVEQIEVEGRILARTDLTEEGVAGADLVAVITDHSGYDWKWLATKAEFIFDTRNALSGIPGPVTRL